MSTGLDFSSKTPPFFLMESSTLAMASSMAAMPRTLSRQVHVTTKRGCATRLIFNSQSSLLTSSPLSSASRTASMPSYSEQETSILARSRSVCCTRRRFRCTSMSSLIFSAFSVRSVPGWLKSRLSQRLISPLMCCLSASWASWYFLLAYRGQDTLLHSSSTSISFMAATCRMMPWTALAFAKDSSFRVASSGSTRLFDRSM
mmetsp:Transcript_20732/g.43011  ORF Transcript_20732/g.43011 Transcript_20732/m.43011 type:complete len:202 (+) Transcript_20732:319-924(+)